VPCYRRAWRVSFNTICTRHGLMLHDRCSKCDAPVIFHRMEMEARQRVASRWAKWWRLPRLWNFTCTSTTRESLVLRHGSDGPTHGAVPERSPERGAVEIDLDVLRVMHQLVRLTMSRYKTVTLRQYVCRTLGVDDPFEIVGRASVETLSLTERHHLVQLAAWLMADLSDQVRGGVACQGASVPTRSRGKTLRKYRLWYQQITGRFCQLASPTFKTSEIQ